MAATCYIVAFDLSDDRERTHLARCLEGFGTRVQKSVFECRCTRSALNRLLDQIKSIPLRSGCCALYPVGASFRPILVGVPPADQPAEASHAFVL